VPQCADDKLTALSTQSAPASHPTLRSHQVTGQALDESGALQPAEIIPAT
jgi:hypothetical protein